MVRAVVVDLTYYSAVTDNVVGHYVRDRAVIVGSADADEVSLRLAVHPDLLHNGVGGADRGKKGDSE